MGVPCYHEDSCRWETGKQFPFCDFNGLTNAHQRLKKRALNCWHGDARNAGPLPPPCHGSFYYAIQMVFCMSCFFQPFSPKRALACGGCRAQCIKAQRFRRPQGRSMCLQSGGQLCRVKPVYWGATQRSSSGETKHPIGYLCEEEERAFHGNPEIPGVSTLGLSPSLWPGPREKGSQTQALGHPMKEVHQACGKPKRAQLSWWGCLGNCCYLWRQVWRCRGFCSFIRILPNVKCWLKFSNMLCSLNKTQTAGCQLSTLASDPFENLFAQLQRRRATNWWNRYNPPSWASRRREGLRGTHSFLFLRRGRSFSAKAVGASRRPRRQHPWLSSSWASGTGATLLAAVALTW